MAVQTESSKESEQRASSEVELGSQRKSSKNLWQFLRRAWTILRWPVAIFALIIVVRSLASNRGELTSIENSFGHLHFLWLIPAGLAEVASLVALTAMQSCLLSAGGIKPTGRRLLGVTLSCQAIANSISAGGAFSAIYGFRWYRRLGADEALAGWSLVGLAAGLGLSLALVCAGGLVFATGEGASLDLIPAVLGVLIVAVVVAILFLYEKPLALFVTGLFHLSHKMFGRPRHDVEVRIDEFVARATVVRLTWRSATPVLVWGMIDWLGDAACLALAFKVLGAAIPWEGLLLAYGAGQLAANFSFLPGGLGAVEGSIAVTLAYFIGHHGTTIDAVLIYRLFSFWLMTFVGWLAYAQGYLLIQGGHWPLARNQSSTYADQGVLNRSA